MMRIFFAILAVSLTASVGLSQEPPKTMPGKPVTAATPQPAANPQPATPTTPDATMDVGCDSDGNCGSGCCPRAGLLARIHAHWCGRRYASVDPTPCCSNNFPSYGAYTPIYAVTPTNCCIQSDERCHGFGVCRFFACKRVEKERCRPGAFTRLRAWLSLGHCKSECDWKAMPTPYHAPLRYYFQPDGEPVCGGDVNFISPGGRLPAARGKAECSACGTGPGMSIGERVRALVSGDRCAGGHCRKEQCYGIPGSNFNGNVRFARDERSSVPAINCAKPYEYEPGYYPYYGRKPDDDKSIQQVQHNAPAK